MPVGCGNRILSGSRQLCMRLADPERHGNWIIRTATE